MMHHDLDHLTHTMHGNRATTRNTDAMIPVKRIPVARELERGTSGISG